MYNSTEKENIEKFIKSTKKEYEAMKKIPRYAIVNNVTRTDGSFTQIGYRPQLEFDFFDPNSNIAPHIVGLGQQIADGEHKFLIETILKSVTAKTVRENDFTPAFLIDELRRKISLNVVILAPNKLLTLLDKQNSLVYDAKVRGYVIRS